jgi:hypothetical protein
LSTGIISPVINNTILVHISAKINQYESKSDASSAISLIGIVEGIIDRSRVEIHGILLTVAIPFRCFNSDKYEPLCVAGIRTDAAIDAEIRMSGRVNNSGIMRKHRGSSTSSWSATFPLNMSPLSFWAFRIHGIFVRLSRRRLRLSLCVASSTTMV